MSVYILRACVSHRVITDSKVFRLGIFSDDANSVGPESTKVRRMRVRMLLYVYVNQLATRIGCTTLLSENITQSVLDKSSLPQMTESEKRWHAFMTSWVGMTKLMETISDMFFPSAAITRQLLLSGRYKSLLRHFQPILEQHHRDLNELQGISSWLFIYASGLTEHTGISETFRDILFIDYQYIRLYINSLAIQAVVERALPQSNDSSSSRDALLISNMSPSDYALNAEVVGAACHILRKTVSLAHSGLLRFAPVRLYLRIISASIFLLKAMSLGCGNNELQVSLGVLEECIQALKTTAIDSMHLSSRYGTLMERHVTRFRRNFVGPFRPNGQSQIITGRNSQRVNTSIPSMSRQQSVPLDSQTAMAERNGLEWGHMSGQHQEELDMTGMQSFANMGGDDGFSFMDDWMAQPFDPSIAPFGMDGQQVMSGFELRSLDFLWNLPT
jgi:hypothetical protein